MSTSHPNTEDKDPDIDVGALVFTAGQAVAKRGRVTWFIARHQRYLFFPLRVVAVVLVHPPAEAEPDGQVAVQQADQAVDSLRPEDPPVPGVVVEGPDLGEHHRQGPGDGELPPRIAHHHEHGPHRHERATGTAIFAP